MGTRITRTSSYLERIGKEDPWSRVLMRLRQALSPGPAEARAAAIPDAGRPESGQNVFPVIDEMESRNVGLNLDFARPGVKTGPYVRKRPIAQRPTSFCSSSG
jgi:hypothetical protein